MKIALTAIVVLICLAGAGLCSPLRDDPDTPAIKAFIAKQAARERGEEYEEARKVLSGDVNHDGTPDVVVLYTIEGQSGANRHVQYLAVFTRTKGGLIPTTHAA